MLLTFCKEHQAVEDQADHISSANADELCNPVALARLRFSVGITDNDAVKGPAVSRGSLSPTSDAFKTGVGGT